VQPSIRNVRVVAGDAEPGGLRWIFGLGLLSVQASSFLLLLEAKNKSIGSLLKLRNLVA
jgi:hypothetical protein